MSHLNIIFDGPPGPEGPRFIGVENGDGVSVRLGEWVDQGDTWALRIPDPRRTEALLNALTEALDTLDFMEAKLDIEHLRKIERGEV